MVGAVLTACSGSTDHADVPDAGIPDAGTPDPPAGPFDLRVVVGETWGHYTLHWTPPGGAVDHYEVVSSVSDWTVVGHDTGEIPGDATQAEVELSAVTPELATIELQIRAYRRGASFADSPSRSFVLPLFPSAGLAAMLDLGGIQLDWRDASRAATSIAIDRAELDPSGVPGAWSALATQAVWSSVGDARYFDTTAEIGKAYRYRITAVKGEIRSVSTEATTCVLAPELASSTQQLPLATEVATDGNGQFAFEGRPGDFGPMRVIWRAGADWVSADLNASGGGIQLDAAGATHSVYLVPTELGNVEDIVHGWSEGAQWHEETIARRALGGSSVTAALAFDLDGAGNPVVVWALGDRFEGAIKVRGTWQLTALDSLVPYNRAGYEYRVFADQSGVVHVLFAATYGQIWHLTAANGVWLGELIPVSSDVIDTSGYNPLVGLGHDPDHLVVCTALRGFTSTGGLQAGCFRKTPAGWGEVERLGALPFYGFGFAATGAVSRDGNRLAVIVRGERSHLFRSDFGGPWTEAIIDRGGYAFGGSLVLPFFDPADKLSVLYGFSSMPVTVTVGDYRVEHEP